MGSYTCNVFFSSWSVSHWEGYLDASIFIFMKVFIYLATSPPSPVLGSYFVIVSYRHTSYTFNNVYPICTAFYNSTDTQVHEKDRSPTEWLHIHWFSVSAHFLHNTNINFLFIWDGSSGMCYPLEVILNTLPDTPIYSRPYRNSSGHDQ